LIKRMLTLALAVCLFVLPGCMLTSLVQTAAYDATGKGTGNMETTIGSLNLNGTAYTATLSINGLPFTGSLARKDASDGWSFRLNGEQVEQVEIEGVNTPRTWKVSFGLYKKGLTSEPSGRYTGKVSISLEYDMKEFDREAFGIIEEDRGEGADFDYKNIKGWRSHGEYKPSTLNQLWESEAFTIYFGLADGQAYAAKTMGHTLSYLPQSSELSLSHMLYYDLPEMEETYIYSLKAEEEAQAILLSLAKYEGKAKKNIPKGPLMRIDLSGAFNALEDSYILLELAA